MPTAYIYGNLMIMPNEEGQIPDPYPAAVAEIQRS